MSLNIIYILKNIYLILGPGSPVSRSRGKRGDEIYHQQAKNNDDAGVTYVVREGVCFEGKILL